MTVGGTMVGAAAPGGEQWTIRSGNDEAVIVEVGGGIRAYRRGGVDILDGYGGSEPCPGYAGQVLAPWPNRIRDGRYSFAGQWHQLPLTEPSQHNAIHGLVCWSRWRCVAQEADSVTVEYELPAQPGYPWPLSLRTRWNLVASGLRVSHWATNRAAEPAPFGLSAHPYVLLGGGDLDEVRLRVPARVRLLVDGRSLPIGAAKVAGGEFDFSSARRLGSLALDTAFGELIGEDDGGSEIEMSNVDGLVVRVWADSGFRWWQVYTADSLAPPRQRRSIAVEPMTCPPDAFRSGRDVVVLQPGQTWTGQWGITVGEAADGVS